MGVRVPVKPKSLAQLRLQSNPQAVEGGQSEALRWTLYDTQTYVSTATRQLRYFQTTNQDLSLSNMEAPASLPNPQYFEIFYFGADVLLPAAVTAWEDMIALILTGRPTFTFSISNKTYGPFPLSYFHASGGVTGFGYTTVAATGTEYANNGTFDGGYCVDGAITIPPVTNFSVTLDWPAALTLAADTLIRVNMDGVLHRKVL